MLPDEAELFGDRLPGPVADSDVGAGAVVLASAAGRHDHVEDVGVACDLAAVDHDARGDHVAGAVDRQMGVDALADGEIVAFEILPGCGFCVLADQRLVVGLTPGGTSDFATSPHEQCHRLLVGHEGGGVERHGVTVGERPLEVGDDRPHASGELLLEQLRQVVLLPDQAVGPERVGVLGENGPKTGADDELGKLAEHEVHAELVGLTFLDELPGDEVDERPLQGLLQVVLHRHDDLEQVGSPDFPLQLNDECGRVLGCQAAGVPLAEHVHQSLLHLFGEGVFGGHVGNEGSGGGVGHCNHSFLWMNVALQQFRSDRR